MFPFYLILFFFLFPFYSLNNFFAFVCLSHLYFFPSIPVFISFLSFPPRKKVFFIFCLSVISVPVRYLFSSHLQANRMISLLLSTNFYLGASLCQSQVKEAVYSLRQVCVSISLFDELIAQSILFHCLFSVDRTPGNSAECRRASAATYTVLMRKLNIG